jgi:Chemotaxis protein histidine kinase and related kinases
MSEKVNKRSLKRRIKNMTFALNFYSLLIMVVIMMLALGATFKIFSTIISETAANQISFQLRDEYSKELHDGKIKKEFTEVTPEYKEMFKRVGFSYIFQLKNESEIDMNKKSTIDVKNMDFLVVDYNILKDDKLIYSSVPDFNVNTTNSAHKMEKLLMKMLNTTTITTVNDNENKPIFTLQTKLNPRIIVGGYIVLATICFLVFLITLIISKIVSYRLSTVIIKPLADLDKVMKELANGNIEEAIHTEIKFKKPISEVEDLAESTNIIMSRMYKYVSILANQNTELEAQNATLNETSTTLEDINQALDSKNLKLKNILDNVEQGFLTFKKDLLIQEEYSLQCEKVFNRAISEKKLSSILYLHDQNMIKFMDELLVKIFYSDKMQRKLYLTLLPEEISINDRVLNICYKVVKDSKNEDIIMTIITDITEKRLLEKKMDEERNTLKMVVKTIINRDEFRALVKEYEDFTDKSFENIPKEKYNQILRQIHTFKGNFSQYEMVNIVYKLNDLEEKLYEDKYGFSIKDIDNIELISWLREDLDIIKIYAGKDFMEDGELFYIRKEKLIEIENRIQEALSPNECKIILPLIKNLRSKSLKDLLKTYPDYVMKLSERLSKTVKPFKITGDDIMIDANYYHNVLKSITHIFRNCVDHGIETEDERLEAGKEQMGNIICELHDLQDNFQIMISDDGRGIDVKLLEQKVLDKGLYTKEELSEMNYTEKINLIFEQGMTTKEKATYISGRGVGMSTVKQSVEECGGKIEVNNKEGYGTVFTLTLPKLQNEEKVPVTAQDFMKGIAETAIDIIFRQTGLNLELKQIQAKNIITLNEITALLSVNGTFNSILMISVNHIMGKKLVEGFMIDNIEEEDKISYSEDVLGEMSNTIIGLTSGKFENTNGIFHIGIPSMISNSTGGYIKNTQAQILCCNLICSEYEFNINMLLDEEETNLE